MDNRSTSRIINFKISRDPITTKKKKKSPSIAKDTQKDDNSTAFHVLRREEICLESAAIRASDTFCRVHSPARRNCLAEHLKNAQCPNTDSFPPRQPWWRKVELALSSAPRAPAGACWSLSLVLSLLSCLFVPARPMCNCMRRPQRKRAYICRQMRNDVDEHSNVCSLMVENMQVKSLVPGGAAEKACAVEIGHQIIAIGDTDVSSSTLEEVHT